MQPVCMCIYEMGIAGWKHLMSALSPPTSSPWLWAFKILHGALTISLFLRQCREPVAWWRLFIPLEISIELDVCSPDKNTWPTWTTSLHAIVQSQSGLWHRERKPQNHTGMEVKHAKCVVIRCQRWNNNWAKGVKTHAMELNIQEWQLPRMGKEDDDHNLGYRANLMGNADKQQCDDTKTKFKSLQQRISISPLPVN